MILWRGRLALQRTPRSALRCRISSNTVRIIQTFHHQTQWRCIPWTNLCFHINRKFECLLSFAFIQRSKRSWGSFHQTESEPTLTTARTLMPTGFPPSAGFGTAAGAGSPGEITTAFTSPKCLSYAARSPCPGLCRLTSPVCVAAFFQQTPVQTRGRTEEQTEEEEGAWNRGVKESKKRTPD